MLSNVYAWPFSWPVHGLEPSKPPGLGRTWGWVCCRRLCTEEKVPLGATLEAQLDGGSTRFCFGACSEDAKTGSQGDSRSSRTRNLALSQAQVRRYAPLHAKAPVVSYLGSVPGDIEGIEQGSSGSPTPRIRLT